MTFMQPAVNSKLIKLALTLTLQLNMYNSFYILSFANWCLIVLFSVHQGRWVDCYLIDWGLASPAVW